MDRDHPAGERRLIVAEHQQVADADGELIVVLVARSWRPQMRLTIFMLRGSTTLIFEAPGVPPISARTCPRNM
jgi:hypothetical protein